MGKGWRGDGIDDVCGDMAMGRVERGEKEGVRVFFFRILCPAKWY